VDEITIYNRTTYFLAHTV